MDAYRAAEDVARTSYGRLVALVARSTRDIAAAEDALGDALVAALERWPIDGIPDRPEAWLLTAARRKVIGTVRRSATATRNQAELARLREELDEPTRRTAVPDRRLELMYACAHPAIDRTIRSPLMLQTVLGLDAARIASAFVVAPATMGQRLSRAKTKIRDAGIPFEVPARDDLDGRTTSVLDAVYAAFGTGWDELDATDPRRRGLTSEAIRLGRLVTELRPDDAEAHGLVALMLHSEARREARRSDAGEFVPLTSQDPARWSREMMLDAERHLAAAAELHDLGPYQLHAAIQSVHNRRALTGTTDWSAIARLYDGLVAIQPSLGASVARAAAVAEADGAAAGLALIDLIDEATAATYQPYWVTRAHLLAGVGDRAAAGAAAARAIGLTADDSVRRHLMATLPTELSTPRAAGHTLGA
jgi:RNA polymerase sigma-70 factor (ECF subfamily)